MIRITVFILALVLWGCGSERGGGRDDEGPGFGYSDYGATGGNYGQLMDDIFTETSDGQYLSEVPAESLKEPISTDTMQALADMLSDLGSQDKNQIKMLVLDMLDSCKFFGRPNQPCSPGSPYGCAGNFAAVGGQFFATLIGHLGSQHPLSADAAPGIILAQEVGMCDSVPLASPQFESRMQNAKQQCMQGSLRGCIRFGLSLIKMFLKALIGALLGALGM